MEGDKRASDEPEYSDAARFRPVPFSRCFCHNSWERAQRFRRTWPCARSLHTKSSEQEDLKMRMAESDRDPRAVRGAVRGDRFDYGHCERTKVQVLQVIYRHILSWSASHSGREGSQRRRLFRRAPSAATEFMLCAGKLCHTGLCWYPRC